MIRLVVLKTNIRKFDFRIIVKIVIITIVLFALILASSCSMKKPQKITSKKAEILSKDIKYLLITRTEMYQHSSYVTKIQIKDELFTIEYSYGIFGKNGYNENKLEKRYEGYERYLNILVNLLNELEITKIPSGLVLELKTDTPCCDKILYEISYKRKGKIIKKEVHVSGDLLYEMSDNYDLNHYKIFQLDSYLNTLLFKIFNDEFLNTYNDKKKESVNNK